MAEQYTGHVSPPVSRDHFTALPLVDIIVFRFVAYLVNLIYLNPPLLYKIVYIVEDDAWPP